MAIDFKNIQLKFVKITGGSSTIDVTMDQTKFSSKKPAGYYKCFIFPKSDFAGYYYEDLHGLVGNEISDVWNKTNRDTLLGYNEETNTFICNITAYMGLKDPDLKIAGEIEHPNQAAWYEMDLTTTKAGSIITLKQTDDSDIYLKIKDPVFNSPIKFASSGSVCIEYAVKDINDDANPFFKKYQSLWAKGDRDVLLVNNNLPADGVIGLPDSNTQGIYTYVKSNKLTKVHLSDGDLDTYYQSAVYGVKNKIRFFNSAGGYSKLTPFHGVDVKNITGKEVVTYSEVNDYNSIIESGDFIIMQAVPKIPCAIGGIYKSSKSSTTENYVKGYHLYDYGKNIFSGTPVNNFVYTNSQSTEAGISLDLMSCSPKDKPIIYKAPENEIVFNKFLGADSYFGGSYNIDVTKCFNNLPDSIIVCAFLNREEESVKYIVRFKKGDPVKVRRGKSPNYEYKNYIKLTGAGVGNGYGVSELFSYAHEDLNVNDLISSTGFTDVTSTTSIYRGILEGLPVFTIYHV